MDCATEDQIAVGSAEWTIRRAEDFVRAHKGKKALAESDKKFGRELYGRLEVAKKDLERITS